MSHTIIYNPELHIIELKVQGKLTLDEVKELTHETALITKEKECFSILCDLREAKASLSTFEIYELPQIVTSIYSSAGVNVYGSKRALIAAKDAEDFRFCETVMRNRGQNEKVFQEVDEARMWLSKNAPIRTQILFERERTR